MKRPLLLLAAALLPLSAFAGQELPSPAIAGYGKDVKDMKGPKETPCPRSWFPEEPVGNLTLGFRASDSLTGALLDTITGLYSSCDKHTFLFFNSGETYSDNEQLLSYYGLGLRHQFGDFAILGANGYFDQITSEKENDYTQFGFGAELLTKWVDARFNYFLPDDESYQVFRNRGRRTFEAMREGYNAELGFLIPGLEKFTEVRVFGGYYHYDNRFDDAAEGFRGRLEARLLKGVLADVEYYDDKSLMGGHWTAGLRVSVPFSAFRILSGRNPFEGFMSAFQPASRDLNDRMSEMVMRSPVGIQTSLGDRYR